MDRPPHKRKKNEDRKGLLLNKKARGMIGKQRASSAPKRAKPEGGSTLKQPMSKRARMQHLVDKVRRIFQKYEPGYVTNSMLCEELKIEPAKSVNYINTLLQHDRIALHSAKGGEPLYRWMSDPERAKTRARRDKLRGLTTDAKLVYQEIEKADNKGLGIKDIKFKTRLPTTSIRVVLEAMATRNLIKWVHTIAARNKKIWMLYHLTPAREDIVNALRMASKSSVRKKPSTAEEVADFINKKKLFNDTKIEAQDITIILEGMVVDGDLCSEMKAIPLVKGEGALRNTNQVKVYRKMIGKRIESPFTQVPCAVCPVASRCGEGQEINPRDCKYFASWLEF
ncbi:hypothetical protein AAMO2058_001353800 [Amorphochlora amoebiformis]